jgi:alkylation response protein AidB-like acyl-CoA dehydrogenase
MTAPTLTANLSTESERFLRNSKLMDIGAGTNKIRRMLIGRELIGV